MSFDDGDHWQSLKLNMASSSVRDLTVKDDDLIAATHGRGFWILDDVTPLRQISAAVGERGRDPVQADDRRGACAGTRTRTRRCRPTNPNLQNPPEGAIINYYLKSRGVRSGDARDPRRATARLVRRYSSADPVTPIPEPTSVESARPTGSGRRRRSSTTPGMHRFTWDVHYQPLGGGGGGGRRRRSLPIAAVPFNTVPAPTTPWVNPGTYTVKLTVERQELHAADHVKQDPRVKTPALVMQSVYSSDKAAYFGAIGRADDAADASARSRDQIASASGKATGAVLDCARRRSTRLEA